MGGLITNSGKKLMINRAFKASPDYTAPTIFKVGTGTTTPAVTNTDLVTAVNINGSNTKVFVTGYPVLDEVNHQITFRCLVNSTEANGDALTEFGIFNTDSTKLMWARTTHTVVAKTNTIEVTYVEKDKLI